MSQGGSSSPSRPPPRVSKSSSEVTKAVSLSVVTAIIGYISTSLIQLRARQHTGRLERVNEQLKELYGPLLACVTASKSSYDAMVRQVGGPNSDSAGLQAAVRASSYSPPAVSYRLWVEEVLLPLSERAAQMVVERADLLEGSTIEPILLQLVAHVSAYKVILRQWREGNKGEHSVIKYPDEVHAWAQREFRRLKRRQAELLGVAPKDDRGERSFTQKLGAEVQALEEAVASGRSPLSKL